MQNNKEIEARFKEVDVNALKQKLLTLGFTDCEEDFLTEIVFYDKDLTWIEQRKITTQYVRLRQTNKGIKLTYKKHRQDINTTEAKEIEFQISDISKAQELLEILGLVAYRKQEKKRHTFKLGDVVVDIDTWPQVPTYVEIEAPNEELIKKTAADLDLLWEDVIYENAGNLIEKYYGLMVSKMKTYTFDKIEYYE